MFSGKLLADKECCICRKKKTKKTGSGWERLEKCETESGAQSLKNAALQRKDNQHLMAEVSGVDIQVIVAKEFYYHRSCKRDYTRVKNRRNKTLDRVPLEKVVEYIERHVISGGKVKNMTEILELYQSFNGEQTPHMKTLISWLKNILRIRLTFGVLALGVPLFSAKKYPQARLLKLGSACKRRLLISKS